MTRRFRKGPRHVLRAAGFAMVRGAAYAVGSAAATGVIWWFHTR